MAGMGALTADATPITSTAETALPACIQAPRLPNTCPDQGRCSTGAGLRIPRIDAMPDCQCRFLTGFLTRRGLELRTGPLKRSRSRQKSNATLLSRRTCCSRRFHQAGMWGLAGSECPRRRRRRGPGRGWHFPRPSRNPQHGPCHHAACRFAPHRCTMPPCPSHSRICSLLYLLRT